MNDLEAAKRPAAEQAEAHQAEEPRLGWSDEQGRWIPGNANAPQQPHRASDASDTSSSLVEEQLTNSSLSRKSKDPQEEAAADGSRPARGISALSTEPIYVQFEDDDPENPFEWSRRRKWIITGIGACTAVGAGSTCYRNSFDQAQYRYRCANALTSCGPTPTVLSDLQARGSQPSSLSLARDSMPA